MKKIAFLLLLVSVGLAWGYLIFKEVSLQDNQKVVVLEIGVPAQGEVVFTDGFTVKVVERGNVQDALASDGKSCQILLNESQVAIASWSEAGFENLECSHANGGTIFLFGYTSQQISAGYLDGRVTSRRGIIFELSEPTQGTYVLWGGGNIPKWVTFEMSNNVTTLFLNKEEVCRFREDLVLSNFADSSTVLCQGT